MLNEAPLRVAALVPDVACCISIGKKKNSTSQNNLAFIWDMCCHLTINLFRTWVLRIRGLVWTLQVSQHHCPDHPTGEKLDKTARDSTSYFPGPTVASKDEVAHLAHVWVAPADGDLAGAHLGPGRLEVGAVLADLGPAVHRDCRLNQWQCYLFQGKWRLIGT